MMAELTEEFYNTPQVFFSLPEHGDLFVFRKCPKCGQFITTGHIMYNGLGEIKTADWKCSKDGLVDPYWEWGG